jgi:acetolactate synthase-1/2/3 large subunit
MSDRLRVSDFVLDFIADYTRAVFFVPGGGSMYLVDALARSSRLAFVPNHHEQASAIAAEAYARVTGGLGVALVTTGPGGTNAITGVAGAWLESVPLLVISGQVKRADLVGESALRQRGPQEVNVVSLVSSITKYAVTVMEPRDIRYHLEKAIHAAMSGRRGPVWIDIPLDVQAATIDPADLRGFTPDLVPSRDDVLANHVRNTIALLNASERPILFAGHGVRLAGAADAFRELAEALQIPVATTWNAMDIIPSSHPLSVGKPGMVARRASNFILQNSDLLISIGARLDTSVTAFNPAKFGRNAKKVIVDVDRAELAKFDMPIDEAVEADARAFIDLLLAHRNEIVPRDRGAWFDRCNALKARYPVGDGQPELSSGPISHYHVTRALSDALAENTLIVTGSSGLAIEFLYTGFEPKEGQRIFHTAGLGAMGFGLPAMVGAGVASGKPLVGIESDGSLMFNIQELLTVRALDLPLRLFVLNNGGYASIRNTQRNYFDGRYAGSGPASKLAMPDFVALAESFGIPAMTISDPAELHAGIRFALDQPGPFLCDLRLVTDEALWPKSAAIPLPDGSMISMPLEDMSPLLPRDELREALIMPLDPASELVKLPT